MKKSKKTLLQIAIDLTHIGQAIKLASISSEFGIDIIEAGTPLIKKYGMLAVEALKEVSGDKLLFADLKTLDTGYLEAKMAYESGADIVSISGLAPIETIHEAIKASKEFDKMICVDLLGLSISSKKVRELIGIEEIDFFIIHLGIDQQKNKALLIEKLRGSVDLIDNSKLAVAGGINHDTIKQILAFNPKIVIIGSAIYRSSDPKKAIQKFLSILSEQ